jgi:energy-coupling factor transporter ATP-binding protein EcfA2
MHLIELEGVTYTYPGAPRPVLAGVDLAVEEGAFVLVAGPSGSGKSTLLRCLNGLVPHFTGGRIAGRVTVAGRDAIQRGPQGMSHIVGFVFQDPEAQFVVDRVEDEVAFGLENAGLPHQEMRVRVEEALGLMELSELRDRPLEALSGGERQRVAIASALAFRPQVLALDEPTSQLDPQSAESVLTALTRLNQDLGLTVILVEHRLERVLPFVDHLVYLPAAGAPLRSGSPDEVLPQMELVPPLVEVARHLGWQPLPKTVKEGRRFARRAKAPAGDVDLQRSGDVGGRKDAQPILEAQHLRFSYNGSEVLRGVDLRVAPGEILVLMGRNGSGKTTLLRCAVGLLAPSSGEVRIDGRPTRGRSVSDVCRQVGYLPQDPSDLLFADTVADELAVTLRNHRLTSATAPVPVEALLARLGLDDVADAYPRDLSVGQRQRVALGAVTVTRPRLLLLDEPTRGLDYQAKSALAQLLREWKGENVGVVLVTHDVELAAQVADRVALLSQGEVIADGPPAQVLGASPLFAPQVARLFPKRGWLTAQEAVDGLSGGYSTGTSSRTKPGTR